MKGMVFGFVNNMNDGEAASAISKFAEENSFGEVSFIETNESRPSDWKSRVLVRKVLSCKKNDHVIVNDFLSAGLDVIHLFGLISFCQEHGIFFHSICDDFCTCLQNERSQTIYQTLKVACELDTNDLKRRSNLDTSKPKKGRPLSVDTIKLDEHKDEIKAFRAKGYTLAWIASYYGVSQFTIKNWVARPSNKD